MASSNTTIASPSLREQTTGSATIPFAREQATHNSTWPAHGSHGGHCARRLRRRRRRPTLGGWDDAGSSEAFEAFTPPNTCFTQLAPPCLPFRVSNPKSSPSDGRHTRQPWVDCLHLWQPGLLGLLTPLMNNDPKLGGPMFKAQGDLSVLQRLTNGHFNVYITLQTAHNLICCDGRPTPPS